MDDFEKGVLVILAVFAIVTIVFLYFLAKAALKALRILRYGEFEPSSNKNQAKISLILIGLAILIALSLMSLIGESSADYSAIESPQILGLTGFGLAVLGILVAFFIKPNQKYAYDLLRPLKKISFLRWIIIRKYIFIPLLIIIPVVGLLIYLKVDLELNRRAFQQADYAIQTIYSDIVKDVGQPDDNQFSRGCGGFRGPYGEGPISCYTRVNFIYPVDNSSQSDYLRGRIQSLVNNNERHLLTPYRVPTNPYFTGTAGISDPPVTDYYKTDSGIECKLHYNFDPNNRSVMKLSDPKKFQFYVSISCEGPARAKFF